MLAASGEAGDSVIGSIMCLPLHVFLMLAADNQHNQDLFSAMNEPKKETVRIVLPPSRDGNPGAANPREAAMINLPPKPIPAAAGAPPTMPAPPKPITPPAPGAAIPPKPP